jgi:two-component system LytT family sensor kinase
MIVFKNHLLKISNKSVINHTVGWAVFIIYEMSIYYYSFGNLGVLLRNIFYYIVNISLFYCHLIVLNNTLRLQKKNNLKLILLVGAEITLYLFIKITGDYLFTDFSLSKDTKQHLIKQMAFLDLFRCIYFAGLATLYWSAMNFARLEREAATAKIRELTISRDNTALEASLAKSRNAYLQQQLNPHLLFNSLNFVYSSVFQHSAAAAKSVLLLADIMRFSLEETDPDGKIELVKETDQLHNLVRINQYRFDYPLDIAVSMEGNFSGYRIIPLVLMTLSENIFKHGDLKGKPAILRLALSESGYLTYYSRNHKRPKPMDGRLKSIGIENIRVRLNYTYGNNYELLIDDGDDIYETTLTLQL